MVIQRFSLRIASTIFIVSTLIRLYESLIDPAQRHDLGKYYIPDWLAERLCEAAIKNPLEERVIEMPLPVLALTCSSI